MPPKKESIKRKNEKNQENIIGANDKSPEHQDYTCDGGKEILSDDIIDDNSGCRTPVNQIKSDKLLRAAAESLASPDESKYFKEFISYFNEYKETQLNNPYSCTNDDVMDICGESGFSNSIPLEQYIKLMTIKPKRIAEIPECWRQILNDYFSETISSDGSPKTIHEWAKVTDELNAVKDSDGDEAIKFKKYLNCVMSPLIESFLKPLPDISSPDTSEHHYWAEFAHRFFSKALQYFANLDWRILEVPVYASKYRKNFGLNHALEKVVDGKFADILARTWDTKEELFVGEQAGAPTNPDLTKYTTDWFKLYRELRDCLNLRILQAMKLGDINYNDRLVFGVLGYLYEMKMTIMWKDGIYIYEEFGSFTIASHIGMIHQMKAGIIKLLEFIMIIKEESSKIRHFGFNGDEVQILKRKFQEIITQTQESPPKRPKSKVAS